jgi:hypothetical protein
MSRIYFVASPSRNLTVTEESKQEHNRNIMESLHFSLDSMVMP